LPKKKQPGPDASPKHTYEDLLRAFLEHIPAGVYFKDRQSRFVRVSRSLASRFGFSDPDLAIGKTDFDIFSNEHAQQAFSDEQEIIRSGNPIVNKEEKETWPDGSENWVLTTKLPLKDLAGRVLGTMGISQDITERKRVEHELEEYRAGLEQLVAKRTAELLEVNQRLESDIVARKRAQRELAIQAEELSRSNEILQTLSLLDDLTGLYNRKGFLALADHRVKLAYRNGEPFSVAFVDLDGLKQINDTFGHQEGDCALKDTAHVLRDCFRESDIIARIGGDEFAVYVAEAEVDRVAARIEERLAELIATPGRRYRLSFSIGFVAANAGKHLDVEALLQQADALMYEQKRAKGLGRPRAKTKKKAARSASASKGAAS
jgi:diguanylate cyclase (GGDEF)-like protein/PAS domain S-box-containing protein